LGELLGNDALRFDKYSSLLWEDVRLTQNSAEIRIKSAKVRGLPGNVAYLFAIPDKFLCPVNALARLKKSEQNLGMGSELSPVFKETGGKLLTKKVFLKIVNAATGKVDSEITGKSFRTGLPSAMENFPEIFRDSHVKALGRWRGHSYQLYMKNDKPEFRWVFEMVSSALLNENFRQENRKGGPATWTEPCNFRKGKLPRKRSPVLAKKQKVTRRKKTEKQGKD
jgi:hypothetical protein